MDTTARAPATLADGGTQDRHHVVVGVVGYRVGRAVRGRGPGRGGTALVGRRQVPYEDLQLAHRLGAQHPLDPLRVLVRGEAALGEGLAQDVGDTVAVGVRGTQVGHRGCGVRVLLKVGLLKVHGSSVPKRDRSRLGLWTTLGEPTEPYLTSSRPWTGSTLVRPANGGGWPSFE